MICTHTARIDERNSSWQLKQSHQFSAGEFPSGTTTAKGGAAEQLSAKPQIGKPMALSKSKTIPARIRSPDRLRAAGDGRTNLVFSPNTISMSKLRRQPGWATIRDKILYGDLEAAHALSVMPFAATLGLGYDSRRMRDRAWC